MRLWVQVFGLTNKIFNAHLDSTIRAAYPVHPHRGLNDVDCYRKLTVIPTSLPGLELQTLGRPARSQSLYRLSYPGAYTELDICLK
jgi:hypothetical protein